MNRDKQRLANPVAQSVHAAACDYRLQRVRDQLTQAGCDAILLYDPVNIRYATDTSNMQVWTMHNAARYALVFAQGPVLLWEFHNCAHLHDGNRQVDEIRDAINWSHFGAGSRASERARTWADELGAELRRQCESRPTLAVDTAAHHGVQLLQDAGIAIREGESLMESARVIKSDSELELMRWTMCVCEVAL
jgi:Xaa-Pro aminopeptidase